MILKGKVWKDGKFWLIECTELGALTQGHSKSEAFAMMADWVQTALDDSSVKIEFVEDGCDGLFEMRFSDEQKVYALLIKHARESQDLTFSDVAQRLKLKSRSNAKHYESGKNSMTIGTFHKVMRALGLEVQVSLKKIADPSTKKRRAG
jgi:hypothetical protein